MQPIDFCTPQIDIKQIKDKLNCYEIESFIREKVFGRDWHMVL